MELACTPRKQLTRSNKRSKSLATQRQMHLLFTGGRDWLGQRRISHFHVKSSEEERGRWGRSKSESLYPTTMINVQEYASEPLVQRGWHLAEFPCTYL